MDIDTRRNRHRSEVIAFLAAHIHDSNWEVSLPPHGTGQETYLASNGHRAFFIKLGAETERYRVMSSLGLSPGVAAAGQLEDGTSILVQQKVDGQKPTRADFRDYWMKFAESLRKTHQSESLKRILPGGSSDRHRDAAREVLEEIEARWADCRSKVPDSAAYIERSIHQLKDQVDRLPGSGLVASHNDVCNGNWLVTPEGGLYLLDYESMSLDDPALDLGAILWWYYPPVMRADFLQVAGCPNDGAFRDRMRIRMAIHNLNIIIPRRGSFDRFTPQTFEDNLEDFRAVMEGRENPQGYDD